MCSSLPNQVKIIVCKPKLLIKRLWPRLPIKMPVYYLFLEVASNLFKSPLILWREKLCWVGADLPSFLFMPVISCELIAFDVK